MAARLVSTTLPVLPGAARQASASLGGIMARLFKVRCGVMASCCLV
jgi:hypothetical protein